jgi:type II secretory pathway pseudopilin PulG
MVRRASPRREAGYNLVILMVMLTVMNIVIAAALPKWSHLIRREKEEELISRGFQYAEAVRVFQNRFQQLPVRIEDLVERKPRSIRKLWKDPMTDDGRWALVPLADSGRFPTPPEGQNDGDDPSGRGGQDGDSGKPGDEIPNDTGIGGKKEPTQIGPFIGVHSRSSKESILIFNGHDHYDEWKFTVTMLIQGGGGGGNQPEGSGGNPAQGTGLQLSTRWLGRPLPKFLQPPDGSLPQDGETPGSRTNPNPRGANRGGGPARR